MDPYPEHTKLHAVKDASQAQGEFIEWLSSKGIFLGEWVTYEGNDRAEFVPIRGRITSLLAEFHGINEDTLEKEKLAMLADIRKANTPK
jgi:hypothetical protein